MGSSWSALCVLLGSAFASGATAGQTVETLNYAVNGGFENGLTGWTTSGHVTTERDSPLDGKSSARFGPGRGSARQRYDVPGLRIILFQAKARADSAEVTGLVRAQCFDTHGRKLMDVSQAFDPKKIRDASGVEAGVYFKTQANTAYIVVGIEGSVGATGALTVDSVELQDYDRHRVEHAPTCDLNQYLEPIWNGRKVFNETVLMLAKGGTAATGNLLFQPDRILSVQDCTLQHEFVEGKDFAVHGKVLSLLPGSEMPVVKDSEFPKEAYPWLSVAGRHIVVTYTHSDRWEGPTPQYQGDLIPNTIAKLKAKRPLKIVAFGDSITLGIDVSGYRNVPPYMPTWANLFAWGLRKAYGYDQIKMINAGLGGMTASWGELNARDAVASLKPDLVLIAFGMNDFWSVEPSEFKASIEAMMKTIRAVSPRTEFILISSIRFDPAYTQEAPYVGHMTGYAEQLKFLVGPGIALLDMTDISAALYDAKGAKGLMADPMHPDDFLARWYAQGLVATMVSRIH